MAFCTAAYFILSLSTYKVMKLSSERIYGAKKEIEKILYIPSFVETCFFFFNLQKAKLITHRVCDSCLLGQ